MKLCLWVLFNAVSTWYSHNLHTPRHLGLFKTMITLPVTGSFIKHHFAFFMKKKLLLKKLGRINTAP